jgi:hypothetical protein
MLKSEFRLEKEDFHKMRILGSNKSHQYEIHICGQTFSLFQEQALLISLDLFNFLTIKNKSFQIQEDQSIMKQKILQCFQDIFDLFSKSTSITISPKKSKYCEFIASQMGIISLIKICRLSTHMPQLFYLDSNIFKDVSDDQNTRLDNLTIILDKKVFESIQFLQA